MWNQSFLFYTSRVHVTVVCVTEHNTTFQFSSLVYGMNALQCFSGTWVEWRLIDKNVIFLCLRFIFACRLVLYLYACEVENPEISGFCVSKIRAVRMTYRERVIKIETQCFFCNVGNATVNSMTCFVLQIDVISSIRRGRRMDVETMF